MAIMWSLERNLSYYLLPLASGSISLTVTVEFWSVLIAWASKIATVRCRESVNDPFLGSAMRPSCYSYMKYILSAKLESSLRKWCNSKWRAIIAWWLEAAHRCRCWTRYLAISRIRYQNMWCKAVGTTYLTILSLFFLFLKNNNSLMKSYECWLSLLFELGCQGSFRPIGWELK